MLRYLRGASSCCLFHACDIQFHACDIPLQLHAYLDSTWAMDPTNHRSIRIPYSCWLFSHCMEVQEASVVSHSSTEIELRALATTTFEIIWRDYMARWLLADFGISCEKVATPLLCHNRGAIQIGYDPVKHELTKAYRCRCLLYSGSLSSTYYCFFNMCP